MLMIVATIYLLKRKSKCCTCTFTMISPLIDDAGQSSSAWAVLCCRNSLPYVCHLILDLNTRYSPPKYVNHWTEASQEISTITHAPV